MDNIYQSVLISCAILSLSSWPLIPLTIIPKSEKIPISETCLVPRISDKRLCTCTTVTTTTTTTTTTTVLVLMLGWHTQQKSDPWWEDIQAFGSPVEFLAWCSDFIYVGVFDISDDWKISLCQGPNSLHSRHWHYIKLRGHSCSGCLCVSWIALSPSWPRNLWAHSLVSSVYTCMITMDGMKSEWSAVNLWTWDDYRNNKGRTPHRPTECDCSGCTQIWFFFVCSEGGLIKYISGPVWMSRNYETANWRDTMLKRHGVVTFLSLSVWVRQLKLPTRLVETQKYLHWAWRIWDYYLLLNS
jgi:hypothetical protein